MTEGESTEPVASLIDVERRYRGGPVVGPVSFSIMPGSCFGLVGANGAGKTTLMKCLLGLDTPTSGTIKLFGQPVTPYAPLQETSGMVEEPKFFGWLSARDNLRAVFEGRADCTALIDDVLHRVGLSNAGKRPVRGFSQGMRQRLGLARVLAAEPSLLVLDEPTNGLDPRGIRWLRELIRSLTTDGRTVLLSSHLLHEVQACADEFLMMDQGQCVASGSVADISRFGSLEDLYFDAILD
ncbi:MAG: ATP-binding cassette domain-containing protein [Nocardioidaceae bacterium]